MPAGHRYGWRTRTGAGTTSRLCVLYRFAECSPHLFDRSSRVEWLPFFELDNPSLLSSDRIHKEVRANVARSSSTWMPVMGRMMTTKDGLIFKGGSHTVPGQDQEQVEVGLFLSDIVFSEGSISVDVRFHDVSPRSCGEIVLYFDPQNRYHVNAGLRPLALAETPTVTPVNRRDLRMASCLSPGRSSEACRFRTR